MRKTKFISMYYTRRYKYANFGTFLWATRYIYYVCFQAFLATCRLASDLFLTNAVTRSNQPG